MDLLHSGSPIFLTVAAAAMGAIVEQRYVKFSVTFIDKLAAEERRKLNIGAEQRAERGQATIEGTGESILS